MEQSQNTVPITILICDDDAGDRMLTGQALTDSRVSNALRFVEDSDQLLDYLYQRGAFSGETGKAPRPGLILLDLNVPRSARHELLSVDAVDRTLVEIPVVFLSASPLNGDAVRDCRLGAHTSMTKPMTLPGLVDALNALGRHWLEIVELLPVPA